MTIIPIQNVRKAAIDAALQFTSAEQCNPYGEGSGAHRLFIEFFNAERQRQEDEIQNAAAADIRANAHKVQAVTDWSAA